MQFLNSYFTPFAAFLVLSALYFSAPDPWTIWLSVGVLMLSGGINYWFSKNTYRYIYWTKTLRWLQVWLNFIWSVPLFYLLGGWWAPMWLLFLMAPATAALYEGRRSTFLTAFCSSSTLLLLYKLRGLEGGMAWGQALVHSAFIIFFSLFVHSLSQMALRLRS
ncbi:MAG: hypothetical protein HY400_03595 [Elusimicrobia bacterium]|nr:hypothetical protein [Elusimicrobiota bacterium]